MRVTVYAGWLMVALGALMVAGGAIGGAAGGPAAAGLLLGVGGGGLAVAAAGALTVWLCRGWDEPLGGDPDELHRYGRPANAEVLAVDGARLDAHGTRTAKLSLRVAPVNERAYRTTRTVTLPGGRIPLVGETVTVKFDPNSRKDLVLLERSYEVKDHVTQAADAFFGGVEKS